MSEHSPKLAVSVAGNSFRPLADQVFFQRELSEDCSISLEREPSNKYDSNAIKIIATSKDLNTHFIGYVPARHNTALAAALDAGVPYEARWNIETSRVEIWYKSPQEKIDFDGGVGFDT